MVLNEGAEYLPAQITGTVESYVVSSTVWVFTALNLKRNCLSLVLMW